MKSFWCIPIKIGIRSEMVRSNFLKKEVRLFASTAISSLIHLRFEISDWSVSQGHPNIIRSRTSSATPSKFHDWYSFHSKYKTQNNIRWTVRSYTTVIHLDLHRRFDSRNQGTASKSFSSSTAPHDSLQEPRASRSGHRANTAMLVRQFDKGKCVSLSTRVAVVRWMLFVFFSHFRIPERICF